VDLGYFSPEPQKRVFGALGFEFTTLSWKDKAALVDAIRKSIAAGNPAVVYGAYEQLAKRVLVGRSAHDLPGDRSIASRTWCANSSARRP